MNEIVSSTPVLGAESMGAPKSKVGFVEQLRRQVFGSPVTFVLTILVGWLLFMIVPAILEWAFFKATWSASTSAECRKAVGGACWAFIAEKHRIILFGLYPFEEQWRPLLATVILVAVIVCSCVRRFWGKRLLAGVLVGLVAVGVLMWGGILGLSYVEDERWGGLPLTLILATFGIVISFPVGVLLALGRTSKMPVIKAFCVAYIELIRGVPLISVLFMASVMLPLFLPQGYSIDKLLRAQIAIILFMAAYIAETVRGGLQAIPRGQYEGAESIGLTYWQQMRGIILPQALKTVIPPLVSTFIALFKDTSLVVIIGIFDLTLAAKAALSDAAWSGFGVEAYVFISLIYFVFCYAMSRYSKSIEKRLSTGYRR